MGKCTVRGCSYVEGSGLIQNIGTFCRMNGTHARGRITPPAPAPAPVPAPMYTPPPAPPSIPRVYNVDINRLPSSSLTLHPTLAKIPTHSLPAVVDLRPNMPPVFDQDILGSCTAHALSAAFACAASGFLGSRLFVYYNERKLDHTISDTSGISLSDSTACLVQYGICSESEWPYDISQSAVKPPQQCYTDALKKRAVVYNIHNDMNSMKNCLHSGIPFVVGIAVYSSFESKSVAITGYVPNPGIRDTLVGGHAVLVCGYTDRMQCWIVRNSWGASWGAKGYFYLPYQYLLDSSLASDLWCITSVTQPVV